MSYATIFHHNGDTFFGNMTGERAQFSANFGAPATPVKPYMQCCDKLPFCGRSGQCWRLGQPNAVCGPRQPYNCGACAALKYAQ